MVKFSIERLEKKNKKFTIHCQGELQILLKQIEMQRNTDFMMLANNIVVFSLECI